LPIQLKTVQQKDSRETSSRAKTEQFFLHRAVPAQDLIRD